MTFPIRHLLTMTATVTPRAQTGSDDDMGDPTVVDGTPVNYPAWIWQEDATEQTAGEAVESEGFRIALHRDAAGNVDANDGIAVDGQTFEVIGPPWKVTNPRTNVVAYVLARIRRTG